ncbi:MAG: flagellar biosynthesis protein FlhA [Desulfotomaculales bacterium]
MARPATAVRERVRLHTDLIVAGMVLATVLLIVVPIPPTLLDLLLIVSITAGMLTLLITLFTTEALQFSVFPTWLLVATLFRLALNIASTRLILTTASAGKVIPAFGEFVVAGSYVVGAVVFLIITVVQFVVITGGAGRVAEVAARFTLDAMPGKQMSIDADFNAGLITEAEARERRRRLQREADFFGAMDGASKFVRGDAIAGLIIILINIIGGLLIGLLQMGMDPGTAARTYTILTIGDGLVAQIPALLISTATGVLVTRATADAAFGREASRQFLSFPRTLYVVAAVLGVIGLIPAMPNFLFLTMAAGAGLLAHSLAQEERRRVAREQEMAARQVQQRREPENVLQYFQVDPLEIEIGYHLISLTDEARGGDLLQRLAAVRRQCALDTGIYVRPIRIRDNLQLPPSSYVIKIRGVEVARGELLPGHYLVLDPGGLGPPPEGVPTREPTFGLPAWWVNGAARQRAEVAGYTVVDAATVLVTHLTETIKAHAHELLGRQEMKELLDTVKERQPALIEELVPGLLTVGEVQKVFQNLLRERIPVRDLTTILEALADAARVSRSPDFLTEQARLRLARTITRLYATPEGKLEAITLHPRLEQMLAERLQETPEGVYPAVEPGTVQRMVRQLKDLAARFTARGLTPVVLCSPSVRPGLRRLLERYLPGVAVVSIGEILPGTEIEAVGTVTAGED